MNIYLNILHLFYFVPHAHKKNQLSLYEERKVLSHKNDKITEYEEALLNAQLEIQKLSKIVMELQTKNATKSNGVYYVEKILDDIKKGKIHYFLIRWKGYGPEHDTWEKKSNLMCPDILKKYLLSKNIE